MTRERVTPDDVVTAVEAAVEALRPGTEADWSAGAGQLRWDCRRTLVHVADCLLAYAAQLVSQPRDHWVGFSLSAGRRASPEDLLEVVEASGGILAAVVRAAAPSVRAWHPYGVSDPEGFAAMGAAEVLVHAADIASGLGVVFVPPADVCERVVGRLFPDIEVTGDAWSSLQWATGRSDLADRARRRSWRWRGEPVL